MRAKNTIFVVCVLYDTDISTLPLLSAVAEVVLRSLHCILSGQDWAYGGERCLTLDYGNFKLTNQVVRNAGSIFHSHLVSRIYSWPLAPSTGIYWHSCF